MFKYYLIFHFITIPVLLFSQNQVPNPGFEIYDSCPTNLTQINKALPWFQPFTPGSSTDYFNACAPNGLVSVPNNVAGYQFANHGVGYAGIEVFSLTANSREYLEIQLIDSLQQGEEYCLSFYVSLAAEVLAYGCDGIGAFFSDSAIYYSSPYYGVLPYQPQVQNPTGNIITDTVNWVLVSGSFICNGGEKYLTIGNFKNDSLTDTILVNPNGAAYSYFFIDDVSVVHGSCNIKVSELKNPDDKIIVYPNPSKGIVQINDNMEDADIEVRDASNRMITSFKNKSIINIEQFENGFYFLKIYMPDGKVIYRSIVLNK